MFRIGVVMAKEYYSAKEFGEIFNISYQTILKAIKNGRIRAFKLGEGTRNPYRIPASEILRIETQGMMEINPNFKEMEDVQ